MATDFEQERLKVLTECNHPIDPTELLGKPVRIWYSRNDLKHCLETRVRAREFVLTDKGLVYTIAFATHSDFIQRLIWGEGRWHLTNSFDNYEHMSNHEPVELELL